MARAAQIPGFCRNATPNAFRLHRIAAFGAAHAEVQHFWALESGEEPREDKLRCFVELAVVAQRSANAVMRVEIPPPASAAR
jgi:hypothetical protein